MCPWSRPTCPTCTPREDFRHTSAIAGVCAGVVTGFGATSYRLAVDALIDLLGD